MIRLTRYDGGGAVFLDPRRITAVVDIPAEVFPAIGDEPRQEEGRRTRVHFEGMCELVRETADEIFALIRDHRPEDRP